MGGFRNLLATLETLRGFARGGRLDVKLEKMDPAGVVRDAVAIARMDMGYRDRRVLVRTAPSMHPIEGDRQKLAQVLLNLIRNAVQATAAGQIIIVEASEPAPGQILLTVEDEGPGVPAAIREKLFAPFVSGRGEQGMGMGLYMARLIVEGHHGAIRCTERAGGGARFEVRLTAAAQPSVARAPV
jgi:signal transduction histidine kinase